MNQQSHHYHTSGLGMGRIISYTLPRDSPIGELPDEPGNKSSGFRRTPGQVA
ncbi:unnamed protein product [Gulo gulo]|uniref:Uncharacterized protein n=1 Tax=Gulo gulo TaxID=48420 RepID=A0A9X9PTF1_GULGU|nr:unnamed protein product [Gulo gulo]